MASLSITNISKRFAGGVVALDGVELEAHPGEVHAIIGQNGAGKTTLMKIIGGYFLPDQGRVLLDGQERRFAGPREALDAGIGIVHQHFSLVNALSISENIFLHAPRSGGFLSRGQFGDKLRRVAATLEFSLDPETSVSALNEGEKQRVEILKMIFQGARVLILDEPTSLLSPLDAQALFRHLKELQKQGYTILLVTHKLQHVSDVATHVTVLECGRNKASGPIADFPSERLEALLTNGIALDARPVRITEAQPSPVVARIRNSVGTGEVALYRGQILGVAALGENGQQAIIEKILAGGASSTTVEFERDSTPAPRVHCVPGDRLGLGLAGSLSIEDNLLFRQFSAAPFAQRGLIRENSRQRYADDRMASFDIRPRERFRKVIQLSGGNRQKVLLARELDQHPDILVVVNPTAGLDVPSARFVLGRLRETAEQGCAILIFSEDLDEIFAVSDSIRVLFHGEFSEAFDPRSTNEQIVGAAMKGSRRAASGTLTLS